MSELSQLNWNRTNLENIEKAWDGDLWDRERLGIQLTNYVDRLQCGAVLALDARWGEGKTWFVRHWKKHLENENHHVIYLDAFANDYLDDPFLTIASEISHAFKECDEIDNQDVEDFNSKTASVLISLAAILPVIAAKAGLHWIGLGGAGEAVQELYRDGKEFYDSVSDEITAKVKEHIEKKIENHQIEKESVRDFKNELAQLAEKLNQPLVFIIDELDRCRPDFAIRLIERIKHFFDIPKIVFVLVMEKVQFSKVICHNYGYDENLSEEYLSKFIDFTVYIKEVKEIQNFSYILQSHLFKINEIVSFEDKNEFFYWALFLQLEVKHNARELIKKINQYALLRTDNDYKNIILFTFLMKGKSTLNFRSFIEKIASNLIANIRTDKYQFARKYGISTWSGSLDEISDSNWYRIIMQKEYAIKESIIDQILYAYSQADGTSDKSNKENYLKGVLEKLAIFPLEHSNKFVSDWENYIRTSI
ncbi:KAP family P-loop NTPase fold protein [Acinetobacter vivianii]|uniref:KAP family P-loop NTPase fold protein n=1 Tax=Acinetobacter vivianii TaxID=1776742 RepID=UPI004041B326